MADEEDDVAGAVEPGNRWNVVLLFDRDSMDFVLGVEVGMLYAEAKAIRELDLATPHRRLIHFANAEMAVRVAEAVDLPFRVEEDEEADWLWFILCPDDEVDD